MFYEIEEGKFEEVVPYEQPEPKGGVEKACKDLGLAKPLSVWGFVSKNSIASKAVFLEDLVVLVYLEMQYVVQLYPARIYGKVDVENPFV